MKHRGHPLSVASEQLVQLNATRQLPVFAAKIAAAGVENLTATSIEILQLNLGKLCNMTCSHCHVDAGPDRREIMESETLDACLQVLRSNTQIRTVDLTGGAPEMNPGFRDLVRRARDLGRHVIDRCNLTILLAQGFDDLPEFLAQHRVEVVASLPCYLQENTDSQRGDGVFDKSIEALRRLNAVGYGDPGSGLTLTLVYNPVGPTLPPNQQELQAAYQRELEAGFGVRFNRLFTITNMPVSRYLDHLMRMGQYEDYMQKLVDAFNPASLEGLMCRNTLSVGWDGQLYDCDFNQMLEIKVKSPGSKNIRSFQYDLLVPREIATGQHCFGCTAGAGSGCQGAISAEPS